MLFKSNYYIVEIEKYCNYS